MPSQQWDPAGIDTPPTTTSAVVLRGTYGTVELTRSCDQNLLAVADIEGLDDGPAVEGANLPGYIVELVATAANQHDAGAFSRKHHGAGLADAGTRARHPDDFSV